MKRLTISLISLLVCSNIAMVWIWFGQIRSARDDLAASQHQVRECLEFSLGHLEIPVVGGVAGFWPFESNVKAVEIARIDQDFSKSFLMEHLLDTERPSDLYCRFYTLNALDASDKELKHHAAFLLDKYTKSAGGRPGFSGDELEAAYEQALI